MDDEKQKVDSADIREKGTNVERVVEGLLKPERLLDYCENFILSSRLRPKPPGTNPDQPPLSAPLPHQPTPPSGSLRRRGFLQVTYPMVK